MIIIYDHNMFIGQATGRLNGGWAVQERASLIPHNSNLQSLTRFIPWLSFISGKLSFFQMQTHPLQSHPYKIKINVFNNFCFRFLSANSATARANIKPLSPSVFVTKLFLRHRCSEQIS